MSYIDEDGIEWGFRTWVIYGEHYITGERIKLYESLFIEILEPLIEHFEKEYTEYKILIQ